METNLNSIKTTTISPELAGIHLRNFIALKMVIRGAPTANQKVDIKIYFYSN